ncbi:unnamed protein product, partial [Laminaria digitata]
ALSDTFCSVPRALWSLSSRTESLMLAPESSRSPGSAFVEQDGATGALAQAMLSIVFRMVRLGHERGLLFEPGGAPIEPTDDRERKPTDGRERKPTDDRERKPTDDRERKPTDDRQRKPTDDRERNPTDDRER